MIDVDKLIINSIKKYVNNELKNHTNSSKTYGIFRTNLNTNIPKSSPILNIHKPINKPQYYKIFNNYNNDFNSKITNSSRSTRNTFYLHSSSTNNVILLDNTTVDDIENKEDHLDHKSKPLDVDFEFKLLEFEGFSEEYLDNIKRFLKILLVSSENSLLNELEIKIRNLYNNLGFTGSLHIFSLLSSIYKTDKPINYNHFLENVLKYLNSDVIYPVHTFKTCYKITPRSPFTPDSKLEEDVEHLLQSISSKTHKTIITNSISNGKLNHENNNQEYNEVNYDEFDYDKHVKREDKTRDFVYNLTSESLSGLTNYPIKQIEEVCEKLDLNPNKLSLEESQFILDEITTFLNSGSNSICNYKIVNGGGKYYVERIESNWVNRPLVVTVMGHVDHGKTTLLDYINKTDVANTEKGFITQKISAFQVSLNPTSPSSPSKITFIDTPGHAAFLTMRERGVSCTDLVILVVAADDGVMPQTLECIDLIKRFNLRVIAAINKVDLTPEESISQVSKTLKSHLVNSNLLGIVPISAKTGHNVDKLMGEIQKIQSEMNLRTDKNAIFKGYVYETIHHPTRGKLINILVQQGTIQQNDYILIDNQIVKVKTVYVIGDSNSNTGSNKLNPKEQEQDSCLIQIVLNVSITNLAGTVVVGNKSLKELQSYQLLINKLVNNNNQLETNSRECLVPYIGINLRCCDQGSLEAIEKYIDEFNNNAKESLNVLNLINRKYIRPELLSDDIKADKELGVSELRDKYSKYTEDWVPFKIISKNLGNFNTNDLQLQSIGNVVNIGFNVQNQMNLDNIVRTHDIIYHIFNDIKLIYEYYFGDEHRRKIESNLIVTQLGSITLKGVGKKQAVGTSVKEGQCKLNHFYSVVRDNKTIHHDLNVLSFQSNKLNVKSLLKGDNNNCLIFKENVALQLNDEIVAYTKQPLLPLFDTVTNHLLKQ
ncbi:Elongation factor Tu GTP binding domain protein [Theileria parva strain Muguga]|uniref:Elongation factor Tu GTP binding domain protein n=1 Tax=Theileria parva strain Muguga TaxID=333668 RepID=UPI001C623DC6|nr:Elongation factor Tu GTP binding domain protein [Theileria parva strain Muguga]EAN30927.2 Elongation factor Tu GTP binding domain protein [Theileria parva strain Muguga]